MISKILKEDDNFKINHTTVRNTFCKIAELFAIELCKRYSVKINQEKIKELSLDKNFQNAIIDFVKTKGE